MHSFFVNDYAVVTVPLIGVKMFGCAYVAVTAFINVWYK